jgi:hypothetical protein
LGDRPIGYDEQATQVPAVRLHHLTLKPPNLSDEVIAVCGCDDVLQIPSLSNHLGIWSIRLQTCLGYP